MTCHLHHAHLFASDIDASIAFYVELLDGQVVLDAVFAGARNVFLRIGKGRLHLYDQPPGDGGRGQVHHLGIQTDDLAGLVARMQAAGIEFRKEIADYGLWKYVMAQGPDGVLLELFQVERARVPSALRDWFE